ncbi:nucleolin 1 [Capsella rubella]|uniref:nucleolin 1 n=1 Tax=Capsella rubella TaxID=81985 RepID=UPI000CD56A04|nr:nucleolin 1 [Capsella rubella]
MGFEFVGSSDASDLQEDGRRRFSSICLEGFDTRMYPYDLQLVLTKHFSSCGKIIHFNVPRNLETLTLGRFALIRITGEGALEKALQLSGTDVQVGGWPVWRVLAKEVKEFTEFKGEYLDPPRPSVEVKLKHVSTQRRMLVTGYDTSLPEIDLQIGLSKHFSTCGEVTGVMILPTIGSISIRGEGAAEKARELSGRDVGGWNITVVSIQPLRGSKRNFRTSNSSRPNFYRNIALTIQRNEEMKQKEMKQKEMKQIEMKQIEMKQIEMKQKNCVETN